MTLWQPALILSFNRQRQGNKKPGVDCPAPLPIRSLGVAISRSLWLKQLFIVNESFVQLLLMKDGAVQSHG